MRLRGLPLAAATIFTATIASGDPQARRDPAPGGTLFSQSKPERVTFSCTDVEPSAQTPGRRRVQCKFHEVTITPPKSAAEVQKEIDKFAAEVRVEAQKNPAKVWSLCPKETPQDSSITPEEKRTVERLMQICPKRDVEALIQLLRDSNQDAQRCGVRTYEWTATFDQVDANTWVSNTGPGGVCHVTSNTTLWRDPKEKFELAWNYKDISITPENQTDALCKDMPKMVVYEVRWNAKSEWDLGCRFIKL